MHPKPRSSAPSTRPRAESFSAGSPLGEGAFQTVFRLSPEAIALTRASDAVIVEVNDEWERLTGFKREQALGNTAVALGYWANAQARTQALAALFRYGRVNDVEVTLTMRGGVARLVRFNAVRLEIDGTQYDALYLRDVTAQRMAEEALRAGERVLEETNEKLNRQVRLYALTEAVARVGHWVSSGDGTQLQLTAGYAQIAGFGDAQVVSAKQHLERVLPQYRPMFLAAFDAMDGTTLEYRWRHSSGRILWMRSRMHRQIEGGVAQTRLGIVQEISAEMDALKSAEDQLALLQKISSRAPGMMFEFQSWSGGRVQFHFVSDGVQDMLGLTPDQVRADSSQVFSRVARGDLERMRQEARNSLAHRIPWQCEFRTEPLDGVAKWLLGNAIPELQDDGSVLWCGAITDITAQKEAQERLQDSETRFRSLTELSSDWYWEQDAEFRYIRIDGQRDGINSVDWDSLLGKCRWDAGPQGVSEAAWAEHRAQLAAHQVFHDFELQQLRADGSPMWAAISGTPVFSAQGVFQGYRGTGRDVSARKQAKADIERLAFYDALTGLPNRRLLIDRLQKAMEHSARFIVHGALLFIDLDNFKILNDTLGHHMGDELLMQVAARLTRCVRSCDTVARLGGDEFVVMLEDIGEQPSDAAALAEGVGRKIVQALNQEYELGRQRHHCSPSIGVTLFFQHLHTLDELLKRADLAMYQAKAAGRNTLRFYDPDMQAAATARALLEKDLRQGLLHNAFMLYYQPVVDEHARVTGVEALLRWKHPTRGMVSPAEFIPVAEQTGLILPLGQWVLEQACAQLLLWSQDPATQALTIAVNVSARQFRQQDFTKQILHLLDRTGANPHRLKIELTESLLLTDFEDAIVKMGALRAIGVGFALDDFGTGYSSLSYLKRLPLDQLKIDQSFVRDVLVDPNDAAIARTILNLAQSLDLGVVAEGVESAGQRDFLLRSGCKAFQGYLFGRPVPVEMLQLTAG